MPFAYTGCFPEYLNTLQEHILKGNLLSSVWYEYPEVRSHLWISTTDHVTVNFSRLYHHPVVENQPFFIGTSPSPLLTVIDFVGRVRPLRHVRHTVSFLGLLRPFPQLSRIPIPPYQFDFATLSLTSVYTIPSFSLNFISLPARISSFDAKN